MILITRNSNNAQEPDYSLALCISKPLNTKSNDVKMITHSDEVSLEWRVLPSNPLYEISNYGELRYSDTKKIINQYLSKKGYLTVCLRNNRGPKRPFVHRLVLETFFGSAPSSCHQTAHWDGIRTNNIISNLRWATPIENAADRERHGTTARGNKKRKSKLTDQQVREILLSNEPHTHLAKKYSVSAPTISNIKNKKNYTWVFPFKFWMAPTPKNLSAIHD